MPEVTKTVTRTEITNIRIDAEELESMLREKLSLPMNANFYWRSNCHDDFDGVEIIHETVETQQC